MAYDSINNKFLPLSIAVSIAFSFYLCYGSVINADGYLYFKAADLLLAGKFEQSYQVIQWPGYTALLATLKSLTGLYYDALVYGINLLSAVVLLIVFKHWMSLMQYSRPAIHTTLALLLIHPTLNGFRDMAIRDYPYWAALLGGLYFLFCYQKQGRSVTLCLWHLSMLVATLFRIEAVIFWLLAPLGLLLNNTLSKSVRVKQLLHLQLPLLALLLIAGIEFGLFTSNKLIYFSRFEQVFSLNLFTQTQAYAEVIRAHLPEMIASYPKTLALAFAFLIIISYLLAKIIKTFQFVYLFIIYWGAKNRCMPVDIGQRRLYLWCTLIAVAIPIGYYLQHFLISSRYLTPSLLLFIVIAGPAIAKWYERAKALPPGKAKQLQQYLLLLVVLWFVGDSLISVGNSKAYFREAGQWLDQQSHGRQLKTYSNTVEASFYAKHNQDQQTSEPWNTMLDNLAAQQYGKYDYMIVEASRRQAADVQRRLQQIKSQQPRLTWKQFANTRGDLVVVIKLTT